MTPDQLEFLITQYLDGTLPSEQRADLEKQLETDSDARRLLDEHRRLDAAFAQLPALPTLQWDRLAQRISAAVEDADRPLVYTMPWVRNVRRMALAACVLIAAAVAFTLLRTPHPTTPNSSVAISKVAGPQIPPAAGQPVVHISIGPANSVAEWAYTGNLIARPSVTLLGHDLESSDSDRTFY